MGGDIISDPRRPDDAAWRRYRNARGRLPGTDLALLLVFPEFHTKFKAIFCCPLTTTFTYAKYQCGTWSVPSQELRNTDDFEVDDGPKNSKEKPKGDYNYSNYPEKTDDEGEDEKPEGGDDEVPGEN